MDITPPVSPIDEEYAAEDAEPFYFQSTYGLQCSDETKRCSAFSEESLVRSGETMLIHRPDLLACRSSSSFKLFQVEYEADSDSPDDLERLFNLARMRLATLASAANSFGTFRGPIGSIESSTGISCALFRRQLGDFYTMLRYFVASHAEGDSSRILEELVSTIKGGLTLIRLELGWLTELPTFVLEYGHGAKSSAASELFHTHMELRWWHLTILWHLSSVEPLEQNEHTQAFSQEGELGLIKDTIRTTMVDLTLMAVARFNKLHPEDLHSKSAFNCSCVKEIWLLLLNLTGEIRNENDNKHPFWSIVDDILERLSPTVERSPKICRPPEIPTKINCVNPPLFTVWILSYLAELFLYDERGNLTKTWADAGECNHLALKSALLQLTETSSQMSEQQRRAVVHLTAILISRYWDGKPDALMILWEFFFRSLDSPFQLPGARACSFAVVSNSPRGLLESVIQVIETKPSVKSSSSYDAFLHLLGNYLQKYPLHWKQKMQNRMFSKLSPKKVASLNECGLFHLIQLFLLISWQTDTEDVALKLNEILKSLKDEGAEFKSRKMLSVKARLALIQLLAKKGLPIGGVVKPLGQEMSYHVSRGQLEIPRLFVESIEDLMKCCTSLELEQHLIIGDWVHHYLEKLTPDSANSFLHAIMSVVKTLRSVIQQDYDLMNQGPLLLAEAVGQQVMPYVKQNMANSSRTPFLVADLAAQFTFLRLELPFVTSANQPETFQSLINKFVETDGCNVLLTRRYLCLILTDENVFQNLLEQCTEKEHIAVTQAWIRCCVLCSDTKHEDLRQVTHSVFRLPAIAQLLQTSTDSLEKVSREMDPFISLIDSVSKNMRFTKDPAQFRRGFVKLFQSLDQCLKPLRLQTSPPPPKEGAPPPWNPPTEIMGQPSKDLLNRLFNCLGQIFLKCSPAIFDERTSDCLLVRWIQPLLLPRNMYDFGTKMSVPLDEAVRSSLHLYLIGLYRLDPSRVPCINRYLKDLVVVYIPRMVTMPGPLGPLGGSAQKNPFTLLWNYTESKAEAKAAGCFVLQTITSVFLVLDKRKNVHTHCLKGMKYVKDVLKENANNEELLRCYITDVIPQTLEVAVRSNDPFMIRETKQIISLVFGSVGFSERPNLWTVTDDMLSRLCQQHLSFNGELFFRMIAHLRGEKPHVVRAFLPTLRKHLQDVIKRRGTAGDRRLESLFDAFVKDIK